jgi:hypothetical protein
MAVYVDASLNFGSLHIILDLKLLKHNAWLAVKKSNIYMATNV